MKAKSRGGKRPGAGRKPTGNALKRRDVMLGDEQITKAQRIGNGNLSLGLRVAVDDYDELSRPMIPDV